MNYLAHLFLSGKNEEILIGNYIADGLSGTKKKDYSEGIQKGITLHRMIDDFTDDHSSFKKSKDILFPKYKHYSNVLVDMFFDLILAKNWEKYSSISLRQFADESYRILKANQQILPDESERFLGYMVKYDYLYNYQYYDNLETILFHLSSRTSSGFRFDSSLVEFKEHYHKFEEYFTVFFPELIEMCRIEIEKP